MLVAITNTIWMANKITFFFHVIVYIGSPWSFCSFLGTIPCGNFTCHHPGTLESFTGFSIFNQISLSVNSNITKGIVWEHTELMHVSSLPTFPWLELRNVPLLNSIVWLISGARVLRIRGETQILMSMAFSVILHLCRGDIFRTKD